MPKVGKGKPAGGGGPSLGKNKPVSKPRIGGQQAVSGSGAAPSKGTWNPGVPSPTVDPFMSAEDIMAYSQARQAYESQLNELDFNYANSVANAGYEKDEITKGAIKGKDDTNWDAAGRGLFRSSIRDADLFDIDATAEMRKTFLDTQLNTLKLNTEAQKHSLDEMWNNPETGYLHGLELKKVANAQGVQANMPQWQVAPHMEKPTPPPKPKQQVAKKNPNAPVQNSPVGSPAQRSNGGTTYPGSKPPARPKTNVGAGRKVMGRLA